MELTYLGTAAAEGWPGIFCRCEACKRAMAEGGNNIRTRSQAVLDGTLLIDFPPDSYLHMLRDGLKLPDIEHILITHTHQDHFYPEELLFRCGSFAGGVTCPLTLYGNDAVKACFDHHTLQYPDSSMFHGRLGCQELDEYVPANIAGYTVVPLLANHDRKEKCFIYLISKDGRHLLYGNDTGNFPDRTWAYLKGNSLDLVSLDCTMGKFPDGTNHMGIPDVLNTKKQLVDMGCAGSGTRFVATHFSHNGQLLHMELEQALLPYGVQVAYDGFRILV